MDKDYSETLALMKTNSGELVSTLIEEQNILLVFLRHFGCVFCKEALHDLSKLKTEFVHKKNIEIVFVHLSSTSDVDAFFEKYGFEYTKHVADPKGIYYASFGLQKGDFKQLFGFKAFLGTARAMSKGLMHELPQADAKQMPGIFYFEDGALKNLYRHRSSGERPDYKKICGL